jgi:hypothetical protein
MQLTVYLLGGLHIHTEIKQEHWKRLRVADSPKRTAASISCPMECAALLRISYQLPSDIYTRNISAGKNCLVVSYVMFTEFSNEFLCLYYRTEGNVI